MDNNNYTTGSWLGIVRHGAVVVLEADTDPAILDHLWHHLGQEPTIHGILHEVTEQFGTGLVDLPSFAILLHGDRLHAILRGDITLTAHTAEGTELVSGRDVTTWSERSLLLPESLELMLVDAPEPAMVLPVGEAVVRLQSLRLGGFFPEASDQEGLLEGGLIAGALPTPAPHAPASVEMSDNALSDGNAGEELDEADPAFNEENQAFDESFARAADAEWNAQLAPMDVPGAPVDTDLGLTIRPDNSEDELDGMGEHGALDEMGEPVEAGHADAGRPDGEPTDGERVDGEPTDGGLADGGPANGEPADAGAAGQTDGPSDGNASEPHDGPAGGEPADAAQDLAEDGFTTNYDFLFGATVAQTVEDAAVRLDDDGQPLVPEAAEPILPPLPTQPPLAGNPAFAMAPGVVAGVESAASTDQGNGVLIDSVPWAHSAHQPAAGQQAVAQQDFINDLAAQQPAAQAAADAAASPYDPDHDGHTVLRGELGLESDSDPETEAILESRPPTGPMVLARVCPNGHANPPSLRNCFSCGAANTSEPRTVGRPRLGTMHISNGEVVELDHSLIIGRQPFVSRVMGQAMPRLVQVKSGNDDISRSHVEVRLDGWDVLLVDLKATNGTVLVREGQAPRRLGQGEEAILLNGDIAELGDGVTLLFDGLL
ncbi:hypothetical protein ART_4106 [Arthrobacter sp. PAMC 25486]|uniref:FHA domain-containing protein n=1 Tax=Arthrobacter sp. PAMC 25486 TaxID=1494608 RepID=UPI00053633DA|nr:FHA domain-containing protein [Arthrobacter sp. PAMC 25486]AIY03705.1 hypothetical protein ART_4106 [Arthrobacter sp. PAMC 25486]